MTVTYKATAVIGAQNGKIQTEARGKEGPEVEIQKADRTW